MSCKIQPEIQDYLDIVELETVPICSEQKQLAALVRRVFETEDIYVDVNQLTKYLALQKYFPFELFAWEKFCFALHCCTYWSDTGEPRFPDLLVMVGRGAGKNGYLSFEDFCLLTIINGIRGYHIDVCATAEDQAKTSFNEIREDVLERHSAALSRVFRWTKEEIIHLKTGSKMRFRTNNAKSKDGLRSGKVDFDEYHSYENLDNLAVFTGGLGKKPHPRRTYATTDGYVRGGPLDELKAQAKAILDGDQPDGGLLPFICKLDEEKEAESPDMWVKANPSLPHFPHLQTQMIREWEDCRANPSLYSAFMTKRMNVPIGNRDLEVTAWENILAANKPLPDLSGLSCVAGIDYARSDDFVAAGLLFKDGDTRYWLTHTFVCTQSADLRRIKPPLEDWARQGLLTFVNDIEISPSIVAEWLADMAFDYNITGVAIDQFRYSLLSSCLERIGFDVRGSRRNVKLVRPSDQQLVEPVINSMFLNGQIAWGENPLMNWYTNNTKKVVSAHGNFSYDKIEPKSRKTDGFMALVAAMTLENGLVSKAPALLDLDAFVF